MLNLLSRKCIHFYKIPFFILTVFSVKLIADPVPSSYVAYSIEDLKIGDRAGTSSAGLIGSQAKIYVGSDAIIRGSIYANGRIYLNDRSIATGSVVSGDSVIKGFNVSTGLIQQRANVDHYSIPVKNVTIGTTDITVPLEGSQIIYPGNYKDVTVLERSSITLKNGVYNFNKFVIGNDVKLILDYTPGSNVEINSRTELTFGDRVNTLFLNDSNSYAIRFYTGGTSDCVIGYDGNMYGTFIAPNALLILHDRTKFTGTLYAKKLELQPSIYCVTDTIFPNIQLVTPVAGSVVGTTHPRIVLYFSDNRAGIDWSTLQINLNGSDVTPDFTIVNDSAIWQIPQNIALPEGSNKISADIFDRAGNGTQVVKTFTVDGTAPVVAIQSPQDGFITNQQNIPVSWTVDGVLQNTQTSSSLQEGLNTVTRSSTDQFGRTGTASVQVTLDRQAPVIVISSPANGTITNQTNIAVAWTIDGVAQTTELTATLTEGVNTITRSYTDAAGNTGTASIQVTLDIQAPVVAISSPENGAVTNQTNIAVAWTVDGVTQTTELTATLSEGVNTITRNYTDAAGNTGTASIQVTLDTQAPVVAISSPENGAVTNQTNIAVAWSVDGVAQTTQLTATLTEGVNTITRSYTDAAGNTGTASIQVTLDTQIPVVAITSPANGMITNQSEITVAWTVDGVSQTTQLTATLNEGVNTITRSYTDAAGNTGTTSIQATLDTQVPVVAITSPANGMITNQSQIVVAWTVDGVAQTTELTASLTEGVNTITRSFTDAADNTGTAFIQITRDTQIPVVSITSPTNGTITNQSEITVAWTVDGVAQTTELTASLTEGVNTITRSFTDAADNTGTATIQVTRDTQVPVVAITSPANGTFTNQSEIAVAWTVDGISQTTLLTATLTEGVNTITRSYTDAAGNTGTASIQVTLDTQVPVVAITSPANGMITNQSEITVAWTVDGVSQTTQLTATLTEGVNTITRSYTDAAGNIGTASIQVTLDTQVPVVAITSPANGMITNQSEITVAWTVDGVSQTTQLTATLTEGVNTITRSYTDAAGNIGTASIQVTLDTQVPVVAITSPANGTITNQSEIAVAWTVDGVSQTTQLTATLTEGVNTITRSYTDAAGNIGTASIQVTLDTQIPVVAITSPTNGMITNQSQIAVAWTVDGVTQTTELIATLTEGVNTITRNYTDAADNSGTASIQVTLDTQVPVVAITSPANGMVTNQTNIVVAWSVDGVAQTTELTATLTEDVNTITRSYTDAAGNIGTASIQVTRDTQVPVVAITSPANGTITNQSEIAVAWSVDEVAQTTQLTATLTEGVNTITRSYTDAAGNTGTASILIARDTQAPIVAITSPANGTTTSQSEIAVAWTVDGVVQTTELIASLTEGENIITRSRTDAAGNTGFASIRVVLTLIPNNAPKITSTPVVSVGRNALYTYDVNAVDQDGDILTYSLKESPTGAEINSNTGVITWNPANATKSDIDTGLGLQWVKVRDDLVSSSFGALTMYHAAYNSKEKKLLVFQDTLRRDNAFPVGYLLTPDTIEPFTVSGINNRMNTMLTYDAVSGSYVVFGGWCKPDNYFGDTWIYKDGIWTNKNVSGPGNRSNANLFYHDSTKRVYLFGGSYYQTKYNDTWEWDGQRWKNLAVSGPSPRMWASTAYIESEGKTILFGGSNHYWSQYVNDTWLWDGKSWKLAATTGPHARENGLMAYDRRTGSVILVGGFSNDSTFFSSTWEWKDSKWQALTIPTPSVRSGILWFDDASGKLYLYGRSINGYTSGELWVYDYLPKYGGIPLTVQVEDEHSAHDEQKFNIKVTGNNAPQIYSMPNVLCKPDSQYTYDVTANDFDGDPLDYFLISAPAGMTLDAVTGRITWIPDSTQIGTHRVTFTVADMYGGIDAQQFRVTVNKPPVFTSTPVTAAMVGELYNYQVNVSDDENVSVSFLERPEGMEINSNLIITWTPQQNDVGNTRVVLKAVDRFGAYSEQTFDITVSVNTPPTIVSEPVTIAQEGVLYSYIVKATDAEMDRLSYYLLQRPAGMNIDNTGKIEWTPTATQAGVHNIEIQVSDNRGGVVNQQYTINVENTINVPPVFTSAPSTEVYQYRTYTYQIAVQDADSDPVTLELSSAPSGMVLDKSGALSWISETTGKFNVNIIARDPLNASATQSFEIQVLTDPLSPPHFTSTPITSAIQGQPYSYTVTASDPDSDVLTFAKISGPAGMLVSASGAVTWVPQEENVGDNTVKISVNDGLHTIFQSFIINVQNVNDPPVFTSTPKITAIIGNDYAYQALASDPENDRLTFSLESAPSGMTISSTGLITWPKEFFSNAAEVVVRVDDENGAYTRQSFTISVINDVEPPSVNIIVSRNPVLPFSQVTIHVGAVDNVEISQIELRINGIAVQLDQENNYILNTGVVGDIACSATAIDNSGNTGSANEIIHVTLNVDNTPPSVVLNWEPLYPSVGTPVHFSVIAQDDQQIDSETIWLKVDGVYIPIVNGTGTYTPLRRSTCSAIATVYDISGNYGEATGSFTVSYGGNDAVFPNAVITSPETDTVTNGIVELFGSATDENFAYYTLSYRDINNEVFTEYSRNTQPCTNAQLGIFDGTRVDNGTYVVRLTVYDRAGNTNADEIMVHVEGQKKIGQFTLAFTDMNIQLPGVSLSVNRTYDSRDKTAGDFGYGWKLDIKSIKITESCKPGENWEIKLSTGGAIPSYYFAPLSRHLVTINIPGGRTQVFDAVPVLFSQYSPTYARMEYRPQPGTYSKLEHLDVGNVYITGGVLYDENGDFNEPFNPQRYKCTFPDGTEYLLDQDQNGVTKITDANSNFVAITENTITHSTGRSITINRDSFHRITSIHDIDGRSVTYTYDPHGNLAKVTDLNGNTTRFKYAPDHYLTEIIDPRGVRAMRTEYDENGRMVRQINAEGDTLKYEHDLDNNREITRDFNGYETKYTYDNQGNVLTKTDAANNTWSYTYDTYGNVLSTRDPANHTSGATFDNKGNELTSTDALNRTTTRTYTASGKLETETDPLNRVKQYVYDTKGNLLKTIGPDNSVVSENTYDSYGNVLTEKTALGNITRYEYDANGRMTAKTDPLGRKTSFVLDSRGNTVAEIQPGEDTTKYVYDANDNQTMVIRAHGDTSKTVYNVFNKVAQQIDAKGNATTFECDLFGQLKKTIAPDSTFTRKEYDADGNTTASIDELGRRTSFEYDHEKRVVKTIANDNSFTRVEYDALGRRTATIDAKGARTEYEYDAVGNNTLVRDAYGNETVYKYDDVNRKTEMIDASGHHTWYDYDEYDRLVKTTFDDNSFTSTVYDADGRKISETDQEGKTTGFEYDSVGNLKKVTDALRHETKYTYDARNNRLTQTDANNHTTTMAYDDQNRMIRKTYPNGDQERFGYDQLGNMVYKVAGASAPLSDRDSTVYEYNNRGREIRRTYQSGHVVTTSYTADGKPDTITDYHGAMVHEYDPLTGALVKVTNPDGTWLKYAYDVNQNKISAATPWDTTYYGYDSLNRMASVIHGEDTTSYFYNVVGNRDSVHNANGTTTGHLYDNLNRLLKVTNYGADNSIQSSYEYTLNKAGIRTAVLENDGAEVEYTYDDLYRLVDETRTGTHAYSISYQYDNIGNRLQQVRDGIITTYTYNNRDQLKSEVSPQNNISYTFDAAGRMQTMSENIGMTHYGWIDEDRLSIVQAPAGTTTYEYDVQNNRISTFTGSDTRKYLIDKTLPYGQVVAEYSDDGSLKCGYVYGLERISQSRNDVSHYYVSDGQGSIRSLTDNNGNVTDTYYYTSFGEGLAKTGTTENEFRYTGEQWDANIGWYYNRARWMSPSTGRFTSVDPFEGCIECGMSLHKYMYANVSPIINSDPSGEVTLSELNVSMSIQNTLRVSSNLMVKTTTGKGKKLIIKILCATAKALANHEAPVHHIATNKNYKRGMKWSQKYDDEVFGPAGLDLDHWANRVAVPGHKGPHSVEYHQYVKDFLKTKVDAAMVSGIAGELLTEVLINALIELANDICDPKSKGGSLLAKAVGGVL
jgi:RHS repeat-associated protein